MTEAAEALARSGSYGNEHRLTPEPSPYVGSAACAPCHRDESRNYDTTRAHAAPSITEPDCSTCHFPVGPWPIPMIPR